MTTPLTNNDGRLQVPPYKFEDGLYLRDVKPLVGKIQVGSLRVRCRIEPIGDPSASIPTYDDIEIPNLNGLSILGGYAHRFTIDPSAFDPSAPSPGAADAGVVHPLIIPRGANKICIGLLTADNPGAWPGATAGALVNPDVSAASQRFGVAEDFVGGGRPLPPGMSYRRPNIVSSIKTVTEGDPSDASSFFEYVIRYTNGTSIQEVFVLASDPQPVEGQPWPLDQESSRFGYQVLNTHQNQQNATPKRNAYVVPNLSDDPLHNERNPDSKNPLIVTAVDVENRQDAVAGNTSVQRVTLANGTNTEVPIGVVIVVGGEFDPSGMDPSAGDASGFSQEVLDPTQWWEFDVFLLLVEDANYGDTAAGFHADIWPCLPTMLTGEIV